jgi:profilin
MSAWQGYIDNNLLGGGLAQALITGLDGSLWAKSAGWAGSDAENKAIINLMKNSDKHELHLGGVKHLVIQNNEGVLYSKAGSTGLAVVRTNQAVIFGFYNDKLQPGQANNVVHSIAEYLKNNGY